MRIEPESAKVAALVLVALGAPMPGVDRNGRGNPVDEKSI